MAGWWDQEDFDGPMKIYEMMEKNDTDHKNYLVVGPWNHGGWAHGEGNKLGNVDFANSTASYFRENIQAPWFAYWLKDKGKLPVEEALTYQTGTDEWKSYSAWPPKTGVESRKLYFRESGKISFDPPTAAKDEFDSYISDPANPVPYRHRPVEETYSPGSRWYTWLLEDQRFVENRPDTLTWETEPLTEDVKVSGDIVAHLFASTTGSDSDWIVKLIDVYPEKYEAKPAMGGYELMIADEVFRGRFRNSFEKPEPMVPGEVTPVPHRSAHQQSRFPEGPPHHGAGAEHLVSDHRSQSAEICSEYFQGDGSGLSSGHAADLSLKPLSIERRNSSSRAMNGVVRRECEEK